MSETQNVAYRAIAEKIQRGTYVAGSRLPSERLLADELGISRTTLRLVLDRLREEGHLDASAQRGWYVSAAVLGEPPSVLESFSEMARARGLRPTATVLEVKVRPSTFTEFQDLQIAPTAAVVEVVRVRGMDDVPVTVEVALLPLDRVPWLPETDLTDASLYALLEARGLVVLRSSYSVQAVPADDRVAALLGVDPGSAVLWAKDITYTTDLQPIVATVNHYRGDAYRFTADLFRPGVALASK